MPYQLSTLKNSRSTSHHNVAGVNTVRHEDQTRAYSYTTVIDPAPLCPTLLPANPRVSGPLYQPCRLNRATEVTNCPTRSTECAALCQYRQPSCCGRDLAGATGRNNSAEAQLESAGADLPGHDT